MFLFNMNVLGFKRNKLKTQSFGQEGGCNKTFFFLINLCFAKCEKSSFFFGGVGGLANFSSCSKSTIKIGISAHF